MFKVLASEISAAAVVASLAFGAVAAVIPAEPAGHGPTAAAFRLSERIAMNRFTCDELARLSVGGRDAYLDFARTERRRGVSVYLGDVILWCAFVDRGR
jgi:hypothetical protein